MQIFRSKCTPFDSFHMATGSVAPSSTLRVDPITKVLGNFGKWQLGAMLIVFLCKIPSSWFMAIILFTAPAPNPGNEIIINHQTFSIVMIMTPNGFIAELKIIKQVIFGAHHQQIYQPNIQPSGSPELIR